MNTGGSIKGALSYNEQKVKSGEAELLLASGFSCEVSDLSFSEKLNRFEQLIQRNEKIQTNTLHLSINFAPGESISHEMLQKIAVDFMQSIGFEAQPFLVYRHDDSSHPHIHIVTTPIKVNGKSIYMHNIARRMSEPARKQIEQDYNLIRAEDRKKENSLVAAPASLNPAIYGKEETKMVISNIVRQVVAGYKFTSLEQLNQILCQFNIVADPGQEGSSTRKNKGLVYSMLDKDGYKKGLPIKASAIYSNPTIKNLEKKFELNKMKKLSSLPYAIKKVKAALSKSSSSAQFTALLAQKNIHVYVTRSLDETISQISFIDHGSKAVFNEVELGLNIPQFLEKLNTSPRGEPILKNPPSNDSHEKITDNHSLDFSGQFQNEFLTGLIKAMLTNEASQGGLSPGPRKKKRRRKKR